MSKEETKKGVVKTFESFIGNKKDSVNESIMRDSNVARARKTLIETIINYYKKDVVENPDEYLDAYDDINEDVEWFLESMGDDILGELDRSGLLDH